MEWRRKMGKVKTHEEFLEDFKRKNNKSDKIEILEKYCGNKNKITCRCKTCNYEWKTTPNTLLSNSGCPICSQARNRSGVKKTHSEFIEEFNNIYQGEYTVLSQYTNAREKILVKHECGRQWWVSADNILHKKTQCPSCSNHKTWLQDEFKESVYKINNKVELLENYTSSNIKILCKCKDCGHIWKSSPHKLLAGQSCPRCSNHYQRTTNEYIQELKEKNISIIPLEEYQFAATKILHKCLKCGNEWKTAPSNVLYGYGCPVCASSKGEKAIKEYLDNNNINYKKEYTFEDLKSDKNYKVRFDFGIFDNENNLNCLLEFDGIQHYKPVIFGGRNTPDAKTKAEQQYKDGLYRDELKNIYCQKHNIKLIRIPYYDLDRIEEILDKELEVG